MFLIAAAFISLTLVLLKIEISLPGIVQKERELEGRFEEKFFINIDREFPKVVEISLHKPLEITHNVLDFANFTDTEMKKRLFNLEFLFSGALANKSTQKINVTIINFLGGTINVTVELNGTVSTNCNSTLIDEGKTCSDEFSFSPGSTYTLSLTHNKTRENITIVTRNDRSTYVGFFDITLKGRESIYKDKFQKSYTLPMAVVTTTTLTTTTTTTTSTTTTVGGPWR